MPAAAAFVGGMFSFGAGSAFAAGGTVFGGWVAGAAFSGTMIGGIAVKLLTTVAISALSSALAHEPPQGGGITISSTVKGEDQPETITVGKYATGGQVVCPPYSHGESNRYLTQVIEVCSAPGATLSRVMLGEEWVELGDTPHPEYGRPVLGDKYSGYVWVKYYDGTQTAADPMMRARYGTHSDRPWTSDMVGNGICYVILTFRHDQEDFSQVPRYRFELDGIPLYDLRRDTMAGGNGPQRLADPSTWTPTENAAVIAWNLMRGIHLPGGDVYGGDISDQRRLPRALWIAAMNRCDAAVELEGGGTEPTYRAGLEIALTQPPAAALEEVFKACSATIADLGYGWGIVVGAPALPVYSFTDDDIIVSRKQELDPFPGLQDTHNAVSAKYPDPENLYETREAPQRTNAAWEESDAFGRRMASLSLPAAPYGNQVQRLMRAWIEDERRFRRHVISLPPDSAHIELIDTADWSSERNGYIGKDFSIYEILEDPRTGVRQFSMRERDPNDYNWRPDFTLPSPPAPRPVTPIAPAPVSGFGATAIVLRDADGSARRAGIRLGWNSEIVALGLRWEIRLAGTAAIVLEGDILNLITGSRDLVSGILPQTAYEVRARLIKNRRTSWTQWHYVQTLDVRLGSHDLDYAEITEEVRDDLGRLEEWAGGTGDWLRGLRNEIAAVRDSIAELDFSTFSVHGEMKRGVAVDIGKARAEFFEQIDVAANETEAVARRVTSLTATVDDNRAAITEEQLARANGDSALALAITAVEAASGANAAGIVEERLARSAADEALAVQITTVQSTLADKAAASAVQALTARVSATEGELVAQSDWVTLVEARTNRSSASGLFRVTSTATPAGADARIAIRAEAAADGNGQSAALFLEARSDGTNQVIVSADRFAIATGGAAAASKRVPFVVDDGMVYMDRLFVRHGDIDTLWIADGAVGTWWAANSDQLVISVSFPARLMIMTSARVAGRSSGWSVDYQLLHDDIQIDANTFSVSPYSWNFSSFRTINVAAGQHAFRHQYSGDQDAYSGRRIAILGMYR